MYEACMNYYAQGGQAHGIKSLAQDLAQYGRNGDTMVAHINPQEAQMLKDMGGSGTINPVTGLPEFGFNPIKKITQAFGGAAKAATDAVKGVVQPVYNATLKNIPGVDQGLVSLDKSVGKTIPGGWGTLGSVAASFIPGAQLAALGMTQTGLATGLGALSGSGVMRKGNQFNLQGAIMGGALAYGSANLSEGLQSAGASKAIEEAAKSGSGSALTGTGAGYVPSDFLSNTSMGAGQGVGSLTPTANSLANSGDFVAPSFYNVGNASAPGAMNSMNPEAFSGLGANSTLNMAGSGTSGAGTGGFTAQPSTLENLASGIQNLPSNIADRARSAFDTLTSGDTYKNLGNNIYDTGSGTLDNMGNAAKGIQNLSGLGSGAAEASKAFSSTGASLTNTAMPILGGATGLMAIEEQKKYLDSQAASGALSNAEYNAELSKINSQADYARKVVAENPISANSDLSNVYKGSSLYDRQDSNNNLYEKNISNSRLYAMGGAINPPDDQTGMLNQTPMQNFEHGGIMSMVDNTVPQQTFASGGMPRFLSGGGDGMSDSIKANINGSQEARLADGEFVVPADVVSHIGNGSSKAGAKQLYSMMDRVRQARVGTKKQGRQINPRKYLAA